MSDTPPTHPDIVESSSAGFSDMEFSGLSRPRPVALWAPPAGSAPLPLARRGPLGQKPGSGCRHATASHPVPADKAMSKLRSALIREVT